MRCRIGLFAVVYWCSICIFVRYHCRRKLSRRNLPLKVCHRRLIVQEFSCVPECSYAVVLGGDSVVLGYKERI